MERERSVERRRSLKNITGIVYKYRQAFLGPKNISNEQLLKVNTNYKFIEDNFYY